jgi:tetratricopeptide (TPR) repeat protein
MNLTEDFQAENLKNRKLFRLVYLLLALVGIVTVAFGAYYYVDRYVHRGDMSPIELGVAHLEQAARVSPDDPSVRLSLASRYIEAGDYPRAVEQAQEVLNAYPDDPGALFLSGIAQTRLGQYALANQPLERYVAIRLGEPEPIYDQTLETCLYYLGQNYNTLGQPDKAVEALNKALSVDRTDADALYQLGLAYASLSQHDQAVAANQQAVKFVPDFTEAYHALQVSYTALNQSSYADYARGMEAFAQKKYSDALTFLERAAPGLPSFAPLFLGFAQVYEGLGDHPKAFENAQKVLELDPGNILAKDILQRLK